MPTPGEAAPSFDAPTHDGKTLSLASLRGRSVVLYFYPEADTPGCTRESKGLRDLYPELKAKNVEVIGVSTDGVAAQCDFAEKYGLPFPLLADHSHQVSTAYGVLNRTGRDRRVTFFIDPDGKIADVLDTSDASAHLAKVRSKYLA
jgi:thioredoxin-dependent peroxiredoxin